MRTFLVLFMCGVWFSLQEYFNIPTVDIGVDMDGWVPTVVIWLVVFQDIGEFFGRDHTSLRIRDEIRVKLEKE